MPRGELHRRCRRLSGGMTVQQLPAADRANAAAARFRYSSVRDMPEQVLAPMLRPMLMLVLVSSDVQPGQRAGQSTKAK